MVDGAAQSEARHGDDVQAALKQPELTLRAILTGMVIGAVLTPCNVYSGLKIGWAFNMSVAAGLIGFAVWAASRHLFSTAPWRLHENNINQTAASAAASIISSGLAAPIPALALLTGQTLAWQVLAIWLFAVSILGIVVAAGLRNQLLIRERLRFPSGIVTAETMQEIHAGTGEAARRLKVLVTAMSVSGGLKLFDSFAHALPKFAPPFKITFAGARSGEATWANLGLALDPSLLMVGFGAIAGLRVGLSVVAGALLGWAILAPLALANGWAEPGPGDPRVSWFAPLVEWLLWPGATLMTVSALASFFLTLRRTRNEKRRAQSGGNDGVFPEVLPPVVELRTLLLGFVLVLCITGSAQIAIFDIGVFEAILAVLLSFVLAIVAARVSGETGITPVGALGKITQLSFGAIAPGNLTANLMTANVTGGAAGQCADLMHDLKTGHLIGATPRFQLIAQMFGVLTGSLVGAAVYLLIIPDPKAMLITAEWPAPAVATWKAVAEVLSGGFSAMPTGALPAIAIASTAGTAFAIAEHRLPERHARFVPSASAMGLGFVIPAWNAISLFLGAAAAAVIAKLFPDWAAKRIVVVAAGLIVGESLAGIVSAMATFVR